MNEKGKEENSGTELFPLNIKIKQEKTTSYEDSSKSETRDKLSIDFNLSNIFSSTSTTASGAPTGDTEKETKSVEPLKSSNEILTELFKVFNAAPPEIVDDDSNDEDEKKRKKRKHKKKSKKKKKSSSSVDESSSSESEDEIKKKVKKMKKEKDKDRAKKKHKKKHKEDKEAENMTESETPASAVVKEEPKYDELLRAAIKASQSFQNHNQHSSRHEVDYSRVKTEKEDRYSTDYDKEREREKVREKSKDYVKDDTKRRNKIQIKSLKDSSVFKEATKERERAKHHDRNKERSSTSEQRKRRSDSEFSISDEEPHHRQQQRYYDFYDKKYNSFYASYREEDYYRHRKRRRTEDRHRKSRSRSHSPQFDKQKLLEIARKNAISMIKKGTLPGAQNLDKEAKEQLIVKMKTTGDKTINELTEYCKKLSNKENFNELSSVSSEDSDHEVDGSTKAFHHPFLIKDPGPIVMNIKNSVPLQPKTAEQTKALLLQFPVSSGAQHRKMESEWVPVEPKVPIPPIAVIRPEKPTLFKSISKTLPPSATFVPATEQQPAYKPNNPVLAQQVPMVAPPPIVAQPGPSTAPAVPVAPYQPPAIDPPAPVPTPGPSTAPIIPAIEAPPIEVFPTSSEANKLDVSTIITQRLNAMRKLQDNPADAEAIKLLYNTQKDMSAWASSKFTPGQFLGSTGVQCLTPRELAEGYQPWAKRDSLKHTAPVTGGMGMHLLQKMGWTPGEGLGKEKNGSLEPLLLDVKLDKRGLVASAEDQQRQMQFQMQQQQQQQQQQHNSVRGRPRFTNVKVNTDGKHPVSILGEYCSKRKWLPPRYDVVHESGPGHAKNFVFKVIVNGLEYQPAIANNTKKEAKATAARFCLQQLGIIQS